MTRQAKTDRRQGGQVNYEYDDEQAADPAAEAEATDILRNEANPKFKLYWSNDKKTKDYVEALWVRAYPGERNLDRDDPALEGMMEQALIEHWGAEAPANVKVITDWAAANVDQAQLESLNAAHPGLFNNPEFIKLAHKALTGR